MGVLAWKGEVCLVSQRLCRDYGRRRPKHGDPLASRCQPTRGAGQWRGVGFPSPASDRFEPVELLWGFLGLSSGGKASQPHPFARSAFPRDKSSLLCVLRTEQGWACFLGTMHRLLDRCQVPGWVLCVILTQPHTHPVRWGCHNPPFPERPERSSPTLTVSLPGHWGTRVPKSKEDKPVVPSHPGPGMNRHLGFPSQRRTDLLGCRLQTFSGRARGSTSGSAAGPRCGFPITFYNCVAVTINVAQARRIILIFVFFL